MSYDDTRTNLLLAQVMDLFKKKEKKTESSCKDKQMIEFEVQRFLVTHKLSPKSVMNYRNYLTDFLIFCEANGVPIEKANDTIVFEWFKTHPKWASATQHGAVSALKAYCRWKFGDEHSLLTISIRVEDPGPQRTLDKNEVMRALACLDTSTEIGIRDLAIFTL
jgi:site-specific recombinase XerD